MTLAAAIVFIGISSLTSVDPMPVVQSTTPSSSPESTHVSQQQPSPSQSTPEAAKSPPGQTPSTKTPSTKPKATIVKKARRERKAVADPSSNSTPAAAGSVRSGPEMKSQQPFPQVQDPSNSDTPKSSPPAKIVVRQGGVSEQSIQLAGDSPKGEATQKRVSTNQMLTEAEENLKKVAGIQLSAQQQSSVSQIRQFVSQSKSALSAADFERAHTLAWKAKVLSDDLLNPKK